MGKKHKKTEDEEMTKEEFDSMQGSLAVTCPPLHNVLKHLHDGHQAVHKGKVYHYHFADDWGPILLVYMFIYNSCIIIFILITIKFLV